MKFHRDVICSRNSQDFLAKYFEVVVLLFGLSSILFIYVCLKLSEQDPKLMERHDQTTMFHNPLPQEDIVRNNHRIAMGCLFVFLPVSVFQAWWVFAGQDQIFF